MTTVLTTRPAALFVGKRDTVIAYCGQPTEPQKGAWLIQPKGKGEWDAIGCSSEVEMAKIVRQMGAAHPKLKVCRLTLA